MACPCPRHRWHSRQGATRGGLVRLLPGMPRLVLLSAILLIGTARADETVPRRVISLDYCADAHLVAVADSRQIAALSAEADAPYAWTAGRYRQIPRLPRRAEAILRLRPDLAVTTAGASDLARLLEKIGVPVLRLGYLEQIPDSLDALHRLGARLGRQDQARQVIQRTRERLAALAGRSAHQAFHPLALYLTPSGVTTGGGTYLDRLMELAGLDNVLAQRGIKGWYRLRLEDFPRLGNVEVVVESFFAVRRGHRESWRVSAHPLARRWLAARRIVTVPARLWGCAGFFAVAAAEHIAAALRSGARQDKRPSQRHSVAAVPEESE